MQTNWKLASTIAFKTKKEATERVRLHNSSDERKYRKHEISKDMNGCYVVTYEYLKP